MAERVPQWDGVGWGRPEKIAVIPGQAHIDAPDALHHVIFRGIERKAVFRDDTDRAEFLKRNESIFTDSATPCFAWALMTNHVHLLIRTAGVSLATLMRRLLTGYAVAFNRRHRRHAHLFQNRYKSILCQEGTYLLRTEETAFVRPISNFLVKKSDLE